MGRRPCCAKNEVLNRGSWAAVEDKILTDYVNVHGFKRCGKSCRLRWVNYLRPDIKRSNITHFEEDLIVRLHNLLGNRWSLIAGRLPGRTDNEIKNYWITNIVKRMNQTTTNHSSNPKPLNQCSNNTVVRTKATRCTKVYIPPEPKFSAEIHETSSSAMELQNLVLEDMPNKTEPFDFMMDLEMDYGFLS